MWWLSTFSCSLRHLIVFSFDESNTYFTVSPFYYFTGSLGTIYYMRFTLYLAMKGADIGLGIYLFAKLCGGFRYYGREGFVFAIGLIGSSIFTVSGFDSLSMLCLGLRKSQLKLARSSLSYFFVSLCSAS